MTSDVTCLLSQRKIKPILLVLFPSAAVIYFYLPHGLGFLCSRRRSNLLFPAHFLLSKKLVAALIVAGESGTETTATPSVNNHVFPLSKNNPYLYDAIKCSKTWQ